MNRRTTQPNTQAKAADPSLPTWLRNCAGMPSRREAIIGRNTPSRGNRHPGVKTRKLQNNRLPGVCRGPEDVDFINPTALAPGLAVTPEWWNPGRGDGVFFETLLNTLNRG